MVFFARFMEFMFRLQSKVGTSGDDGRRHFPRRRPSALDIIEVRDFCGRVTAHRGDGGPFAKISGTGEARAVKGSDRPGLRFQISLDWKRMRDEEHSLKTA
jgi:hypothetical protein